MDVLSAAGGAAGVGLLYFVYLASTKGLPAAWAWLKAKWNAGKAAASALQADINDAHERITSLEHKFDSVEASIASMGHPAPAAAAAAAPAANPAPAPAPAPVPTAPAAAAG